MSSKGDAAAGTSRITRSASTTIPNKTILPKAQELRPKPAPARIPSPTRLPVGSIKRSESVRQTSTTSAISTVPRSKVHSRQASTGTASLNKPSQNRSASGIIDGNAPRPSSVVRKNPTISGRDVRSIEKPPYLRRPSTSGPDKPTAAIDPPSAVLHRRTASTSNSRPQFNALQKDFAPRKSSTTTASVTQGAAIQPSEVLESTSELSQLHTIHSRSSQTQAQWVESAREVYDKGFQNLVELNRTLNNREKADMFQKNAQAIIEWAGKSCPDTLDRRVKVVSTAIDEFWHSSDPSGRYAATIDAFEHWYDTISQVQQGSGVGQAAPARSTQLMGGLGDGWKAEVESLQDRLLQTAQDVLSLGEIDPDADLARCIALLSEMIQNMLEELETLVFIEQSVVLQEQYWMQSSIDQLSHGLHKTRIVD